MPSLLSLIKKAAVDAVWESSPCAVFFGRVLSASPPRISVEDRFVLEPRQIIITDSVQNLKTGDIVIFLRAQGGSVYIVTGCITEGEMNI